MSQELVYGVVYCIDGIWTLHDQMWNEAGPAAQSMREIQSKAQAAHMARNPGSQLRTAAMPIAIRTSILESWNDSNKVEEVETKVEVEVEESTNSKATDQPDRSAQLS